MDVTTKQWLTILVIVVIVGIFLDGFRRMRKARRDSLTMSLNPKKATSVEVDGNRYGSEFPNGGARSSEREIDPERIAKVRSQYDFGTDMTCLKEDRLKGQQVEIEPQLDYNHGQWVDSDEGDEDYYGQKWDYESMDEGEDDTLEEESTPSLSDLETFEDKAVPLMEESIEQAEGDFSDDNGLKNSLSTSEIVAKRYTEPEQVSLNLEDTVPVLMETTEPPEKKQKKQIEPQLSDTDDILLEKEEPTINIHPVGKRIRKNIEPVVGDDQELDTRSANKPQYKSKYFSHTTKLTSTADQRRLEEVLILHIRSTDEVPFEGTDLLHVALQQGMRYGAMDIFHFHTDEDGEGPVLFSMANMLMPGVFDLKTIDEFSTIGVTFFMTMPVVDNNNMAAFESMLATAKEMADELGGELKDEQRSVMTAQTIEHYRERIRDFSRKQQLQKNK